MSQAALPLAVSLGDPAGIGPEIIVASWAQLSASSAARPFFVVGGCDALRSASELRSLDCPLVPIADPAEANAAWHAGLPVLAGLDTPYMPGRPTHEGAQVEAGAALIRLEEEETQA